MDLVQSFTSTDAAITARFAVGLSDDPTYAGGGNFIVVEGEAMPLSALTLDPINHIFYELTLPKFSSIHALGRRYLFLGFRISTTILLGSALFTAGAVNAHLLLSSQEGRTSPYVSGWNAKGA